MDLFTLFAAGLVVLGVFVVARVLLRVILGSIALHNEARRACGSCR